MVLKASRFPLWIKTLGLPWVRGPDGQSVGKGSIQQFPSLWISQDIDPPPLEHSQVVAGFFSLPFSLLLSILASAFCFPRCTVGKNQSLLDLSQAKALRWTGLLYTGVHAPWKCRGGALKHWFLVSPHHEKFIRVLKSTLPPNDFIEHHFLWETNCKEKVLEKPFPTMHLRFDLHANNCLKSALIILLVPGNQAFS